MVWKLALCLLIGYLFGSVLFAVVVSKTVYHYDVRKYGSGNPGANNVARLGREKFHDPHAGQVGFLTFALDAVKAVAAMLLCRLLFGLPGETAAAFGCLVGHCWPLFYQFKGGKCVAVSFGIVLILNWKLFLIWLVVFFAIWWKWGYFSLGSMTVAGLLPFMMLLMGGFSRFEIALGVGIAEFVIIRHHENMDRLYKRKESRTPFPFTKKRS